MRRFIYTSANLDGSFHFAFTDAGFLAEFDLAAELSDQHHAFLLKRLPMTVEELPAFTQGLQGKLREVHVADSLTFSHFWDTYAYKVGNKARAERLWNKMSKTQRVKALDWISAYDSERTKTSAAKLYPETYLNQQRWNA